VRPQAHAARAIAEHWRDAEAAHAPGGGGHGATSPDYLVSRWGLSGKRPGHVRSRQHDRYPSGACSAQAATSRVRICGRSARVHRDACASAPAPEDRRNEEGPRGFCIWWCLGTPTAMADRMGVRQFPPRKRKSLASYYPEADVCEPSRRTGSRSVAPTDPDAGDEALHWHLAGEFTVCLGGTSRSRSIRVSVLPSTAPKRPRTAHPPYSRQALSPRSPTAHGPPVRRRAMIEARGPGEKKVQALTAHHVPSNELSLFIPARAMVTGFFLGPGTAPGKTTTMAD